MSNVTSRSSDSLMLTISLVLFQPILYLHCACIHHRLSGSQRRTFKEVYVYTLSFSQQVNCSMVGLQAVSHRHRSGSAVCCAPPCNCYLPTNPTYRHLHTRNRSSGRQEKSWNVAQIAMFKLYYMMGLPAVL